MTWLGRAGGRLRRSAAHVGVLIQVAAAALAGAAAGAALALFFARRRRSAATSTNPGTFVLERFFAEYEFNAKHQICNCAAARRSSEAQSV